MKKLLLLLVLVSGFATAQWSSSNIVDDFGDITNTVRSQSVTGKFSNSAANNRELVVKITDFENLYRFTFYEYGSVPTSFHYKEHSVDYVITMKAPDGTKISGTVTYMPGSDQGIYIYKKNKLGKAIMNSAGEFTFVTTDRFGHGIRAKYSFKFKGAKLRKKMVYEK